MALVSEDLLSEHFFDILGGVSLAFVRFLTIWMESGWILISYHLFYNPHLFPALVVPIYIYPDRDHREASN